MDHIRSRHNMIFSLLRGRILRDPSAIRLATTLIEHGPHQGPLLLVHPRQSPPHHFAEAQRLAASLLGAAAPIATLQLGPSRLGRPSPATYFGSGAVQALVDKCSAVEPRSVFVNARLSGIQQRKLEAALGRPVVDRVGLIIDIFAQRARTKEARLQVELAALEFAASRLVRIVDPKTGQRRGFGLAGEVEVVSARERGRSGSGSGGLGGAGGGGESELELQGRRLAIKRARLRRQLQAVRRTREVQRAGRRQAGLPLVALVGYTNAGKTSLLRAATKNAVGRGEDTLFATLDPTARRVELPSGRAVILSDTVGFISDLPVQLVDAFRSTLESVVEADLLVHVVDASSAQAEEQRRIVLGVLREIGVGEDRLCGGGVIEVWNKADLAKGWQGGEEEEEERGNVELLRVTTSAVTGAGVQELLSTLDAVLPRRIPVPFEEGDAAEGLT